MMWLMVPGFINFNSTFYGRSCIHEPLLTCSCSATYDSGTRDAKRHEERIVHRFLVGIYTPFYAQTRDVILALENLPSLDRVYQMVIQDESVRLMTQPPDPPSS